jgi:NhaP-type Na+/H+ or K+/H+ antiporter
VFGYVIGVLTRKVIGWLQARGAKPFHELTVVFAMAYFAYYGCQAMLNCSGVVAVVVYGLYGSAKGKFEVCMSFGSEFGVLGITCGCYMCVLLL